jgi:hypothetical protein
MLFYCAAEGTSLGEKRFEAIIHRTSNVGYIVFPFVPSELWGEREVYHVGGSIDEEFIRGNLEKESTRWVFPIGAAWLRDHELADGDSVDVELSPFGHQLDTIAPDIAEAFRAEPEAGAFFEAIAPFYRNNTIRWIESAKRPETRQRRIAESVARLKAGVKQR